MSDTERAGRGRADRDVLLAVLALQHGVVDESELVAAARDWVADKTRSFAAVLRARGRVEPSQSDRLEALVAALLERHGGNPERALAAVDPLGPVRRRLAEIEDEDLQESLAWVGRDQPTETLRAGDETITLDTRPIEPAADGARFRVLAPHAHGGLGEILVALDMEFDRKVALKRVRDRFADEPGSQAMLRLEGVVTGRLEHPGIVPVYGLGHDASGRPYYAMRFIKGDSLREAIARFHRLDTPARDPGERALTLRRLLGRFIDVCNAVEYAHVRGVLHRDLKPGNIMLGRFGETLVVDWGLAKVIGHPDHPRDPDATEATLRPFPNESDEAIPQHSVQGTLRYMSPEQAAGRNDLLGPTSDVYSLGATLYCLLTGKAPISEPDTERARALVRKGEFPSPREIKAAVPASLEAVCLKAMARVQNDRYFSARALADDVERWLADEPVSALADPLLARASRWVRRHRSLAAAAAALLITATLTLSVAAWFINNARREAVDQRDRAVAAEALARTEKQAADQQRARADEARDQALAARQEAVEQRDRALTAEAQARAQKQIADEQRARAEVSRRQALATSTLARAVIRESLVQLAEEGLASIPQMEKPRRQIIDKAVGFAHELVKLSGDDPDALRDAALIQRQAANIYRLTGGYEQAFPRYQEAIALYDKLLDPAVGNAQDRGARVHVLVDHAEALRMAGNRAAARTAYRKALEQAQALPADQADPRFILARARYNLAAFLIESGEYVEARALDEAAAEALRELIDQFKTEYRLRLAYIFPLRHLGVIARARGDVEGARQSFDAALGQLATLVDLLPARHAYESDIAAHRASTFVEQARLLADDPKTRRQARELLDQAVAIRTKLSEQFPSTPHRRHQRAEVRILRAELADDDPERRHEWEDDVTATARDLERSLEERPQTPYIHGYLGRAYGFLGRCALDRKDHAAARAHLVKAVAATTRALDDNPASPLDIDALRSHRAALGKLDALPK